MALESTETLELDRHGGKLTLVVEYTKSTGRPIRLYKLKMSVTASSGCSPYVFVYQRVTAGAPAEDGSPRDEFVCVADELDEDEINREEDGPDIAHGVPYYRSKSVELLFRSYAEMADVKKAIVSSISSS